MRFCSSKIGLRPQTATSSSTPADRSVKGETVEHVPIRHRAVGAVFGLHGDMERRNIVEIEPANINETYVQIIGRKIVLYREGDAKHKKITLPRAVR